MFLNDALCHQPGIALNAFKIQIDIEPAEISQPTVRPDLPVLANIQSFLSALANRLDNWRPAVGHRAWLAWCRQRLLDYPNVRRSSARQPVSIIRSRRLIRSQGSSDTSRRDGGDAFAERPGRAHAVADDIKLCQVQYVAGRSHGGC